MSSKFRCDVLSAALHCIIPHEVATASCVLLGAVLLMILSILPVFAATRLTTG